MTNNSSSGASSPPAAPEPEPSLAGYPPPVPYGQPVPYGPPGPYGQPVPYGPPVTSGQRPPYSQPSPYSPVPYGQPYAPAPFGPPPNWPAPPLDALPDGPREYQHMLRGPRYRWWRPVLTLLLVVLISLPLMLLAFVPVVLAGAAVGIAAPLQWAAREIIDIADLGPAGLLYVNLSLIALIPAAGLSIWAVHRIRPRYLSSVTGGIRWRWLLRCLVIVVPVWAVYLGVSALLTPVTSPRPDQWVLLLVIVVLTTPFQAAGEEYLFRGWIMQNVGSWFRNPTVALVAGLTVSVVVFSAAHGSPDIWVLGSLGVFALTAGIATWRTGGLEAAIAIHAVNNVGVFFIVILLGGWQNVFVGSNTTGRPLDVAIALAVHAVTLALILWQAKKAGVQRRFQPAQLATAAISPATVQPGYAPLPQG